MKPLNLNNLKILLVALVLIATPLGDYGIQKAEAQSTEDLLKSLLDSVGDGLQVSIVGNTSKPDTATALQGTLSRIFLGKSSDELQSINFKEMVLDPIAWQMKQQGQQQASGNWLKWLGGQLPGQNGEVPFFQNYTQVRQDINIQALGTHLTEDKAGDAAGTCDPERSHKVLTAILNSYREDINSAEGGTALSCPAENSTAELQEYSSLAHKIMGDFLECRDETCAYFAGRTEGYLRAVNAQEAEKEIRSHSRGMKPQRVCKVINDPDGKPRQLCEIVNPLYLAADSASFQVAQMPGLQLLQEDEFGEIISSFMNQLTTEAVTGISSLANNVDFTGVLGLSGNPDYTNLLFGPDGGLSYVDSLVQDDISKYQSGITNPIQAALVVEQKNLSMQTFMFNEVDALKKKTDSNKTQFGSCYDLSLTQELTKAMEDAEVKMLMSSTSVAILNTLNNQYINATDASTRNAAVTSYTTYKSQGFFATEQENQTLEITIINYTFKTMVDEFKYKMALEQQECGGQFDYDGVLGGPADSASGSGI